MPDVVMNRIIEACFEIGGVYETLTWAEREQLWVSLLNDVENQGHP